MKKTIQNKDDQVKLCGQVYVGESSSGGTLYPKEIKGWVAFNFSHNALAKYNTKWMDFEVTLKNPVDPPKENEPQKSQEVRLKE